MCRQFALKALTSIGFSLGFLDGPNTGELEGLNEGSELGLADGLTVGNLEGLCDGLELGGGDGFTKEREVSKQRNRNKSLTFNIFSVKVCKVKPSVLTVFVGKIAGLVEGLTLGANVG